MKNLTKVHITDPKIHPDHKEFKIIARRHDQPTKLDIHRLECLECGAKLWVKREDFE